MWENIFWLPTDIYPFLEYSKRKQNKRMCSLEFSRELQRCQPMFVQRLVWHMLSGRKARGLFLFFHFATLEIEEGILTTRMRKIKRYQKQNDKCYLLHKKNNITFWGIQLAADYAICTMPCWLRGPRIHRLPLCRGVRPLPNACPGYMTLNNLCPVGWSCRIHRLLLYSGVRHPPTSVLDMILNNLMMRLH